MASVEEVTVEVVPRISPEFQQLADVAGDVVGKVNAGAELAHAMYHAGAEFITTMPVSVARAYMKACAAYGIES